VKDPTRFDPRELPSYRALHAASVVAVLVAGVLLTTAVLPAEWGLDPTGVGRILGLTAMGELKQAAAPAHAEPASAATEVAPAAYAFRRDELALTLQAGEGTEVKAVMRAGDQLVYAWSADRGELFFDFHGEAKGAPPDVFTSYEKGSAPAAEGEFEAPFEGIHGWYWKNRTDAPITVKLTTSGVYASISRK
jgi:hypothetical protein